MKIHFNICCLFLLILCIGSQALARDSRFALSRSGQIMVKGDHYYPPFEFINEDGRPDGFNVELFRALAEELGLDYRLELGPWGQVRDELESGQIDVVMGMIYSPERAQNIAVTSSDIDPQDYAIAVSQNNEELLRLLDMGLYHLKAIGTYDELYKKWFSVYEEGVFFAEYKRYIILALAIFALLALFILVLRLRVKNVKKQLQESEIRYRNIFANEHVVMLIIDPETGLITDANPAAERFYGYLRPRLLQMNISDINIMDMDDIVKEMEKAQSGEKKYFAFRHRLATGEVRDVDVYSVKIIINAKNFLYSIIYDATEKREAENNARALQGLLQYIIRFDPNAIAVLDNDLRFVFVSDRFINDYNVKDGKIIGKHHYDIFPDVSERWKEVHQRALKGEVLNSDDDTFIRQDGTVEHTRWECRPWHNRDGSIGGIILYTEVITKRKQVELELETLKNKLEIEVKDKTAELEERIKELERFHDATIEREFRIKELRDEVKRLEGAKS